MFELAEDSSEQLDSYIDSGRVLVAVAANEPIGHIQLVDTGRRGEVEVKNLAVAETRQGRGIGRMLMAAAIDEVAAASGSRLLVATAAAGTGNLRFYQRLGFRLPSIERDAFTTATGYPAGIRWDGIELRDRVWLDLTLEPPSPAPSRVGAGRAVP
ncbi:MAG: GNAT family N-acetyltransferase [Pseudonocardiaceae bacterium]